MSETPNRPKLVAILGVKGGVGSTFIAVNLAAVVAETTTAVVADFDFCKGDVGTYLDVEPVAMLGSLLSQDTAIDEAAIRRIVVSHNAGFDALCQPHDLAGLHAVTRDNVVTLLTGMQEGWEVVIADLGSRIDIPSLTTALMADQVVLVTNNTIPALRNAQRVLSLLTDLKVQGDKIRLVVNKYTRGQVELDEVGAHLERGVTTTIVRDDAACKATDLYGMLAVKNDSNPLSRPIRRLWSALQGVPEAPPRSFWKWSRKGDAP